MATSAVTNRVGLGVEFSWHHDRFAHRIVVLDGSVPSQTLFESVPGREVDSWPASPVFQELTALQETDQASPLLLVGKCGTSHWSASVEPVRQGGKIDFDIACRFAASPSFIGNTYQAHLPGNASITTLNHHVAQLRTEMWEAQLKIAEDSRFVRPKLIVDGSLLKIQCNPFHGQLPATVRWRYSVQLRRTENAQLIRS